MSLPSKKFREIVVQILYSLEMGKECDEDFVPFMMGEFKIPRKLAESAIGAALNVFASKEKLDKIIALHSVSYDVERIGVVERNILRYTFDSLEKKEESATFLVNEALRITSKFSTEASASFVHAILEASLKEGNEHAPSV